MAENSKIEMAVKKKSWYQKVGFNQLTTEKVAATKTGCDLETWRLKREMGLRWCTRCREWKRAAEFSIDRSRATQSKASCLPCSSLASRASKYRITFAEAKALIAKGCAICGRSKSMHIDHCHKTGKVRDGLCGRCNVGLGLFMDDSDLIKKALNYLEAHNGRTN